MELEQILNSKQFEKYLNSDGVKRYMYFSGLGADWVPTVADAAMYLYESMGKKYCKDCGIELLAGVLHIDGVKHVSMLALGKRNMDLTVSMWLEDAGTIGFSLADIKSEVVSHVGKNGSMRLWNPE